MFTAALFTTARAWKQPRCPSMDEQIKKLLYIYAVENYSTIKSNEFLSVLVRWMNLELIHEPRASCLYSMSKSEREKQISYINANIWNLEK